MADKICRSRTIIAYAATICCCAALMSGCAKKTGEERVVASIGAYNMTVEDFNYNSNKILGSGKAPGSPPVTKKDVLDALIIKEVLIQEAVRENLDKEKDFAASLELYWEQALIKNLLAKKSREIANRIAVYDDEIAGYCEKAKNKIKARIFVFNGEKSAENAAREKNSAFESWEQAPQKFAVSYTVPPRWYILGAEQSPLEYDIFNVDPGKGRGIARVDGGWALIIVEETAPGDLARPVPSKEEAAQHIRAAKSKKAMDEWIDSVRSKTRVKINENVLNSLD